MPVTQETIRESTFTGRFYSRRTGQIVREFLGKNGKTRAPMLKDMEADSDLVPSVTTVLKDVGGYDFLTAMTAIEYAQELVNRMKEPLNERDVKRLALDACIDSSEAQEFGTNIHHLNECVLRGVSHGLPQEYLPWERRFNEWRDLYQVKPIVIETPYVRPVFHQGVMWVGGTVDLIAQVTLPSGQEVVAAIDYKTQSFDPDSGAKPYDKWAVQMASYDIMSGIDIDVYMSPVIPSRAADKYQVFLWWDLPKYRQIFVNHLHNWYLQYAPGARVKPEKIK